MNQDYNPNSVNAVLSRIETKLDESLRVQKEHSESISKLWSALGRIDVRVTAIAVGISAAVGVVKLLFFH